LKRSSERKPLRQSPKSLSSREILLAVTGSVAAYKSVELIRRLRDEGAGVSVIMTEASKGFITPLSLELASGRRPLSGLFDEPLSHIELPSRAEVFVIAPATANIIAKLANGIADDLVSTSALAYKGPLIIAPAMNWRMYENPAFRRNLKRLKDDGSIIVEPESGTLACGDVGVGRMASPAAIISAIKGSLREKDLLGRKLIITAGPTREYIDRVRFISNPSSGKMGFALAVESAQRGADVVLISGPTGLERPVGVRYIEVETTDEMRDAVFSNLSGADAVIMSAAPADFSPIKREEGKLSKDSITDIKLRKTPDILSELGSIKDRDFLLMGFSAEAGESIDRAKRKLLNKHSDIIVLNDITLEGSGFGSDSNKVVIIDRKGLKRLPLMSKSEVARLLIDRVVKELPFNVRKT